MAFLTRNRGGVIAQGTDLQRIYLCMVMCSAALAIPVEESRPTSVLAIDCAEKSRDKPRYGSPPTAECAKRATAPRSIKPAQSTGIHHCIDGVNVTHRFCVRWRVCGGPQIAQSAELSQTPWRTYAIFEGRQRSWHGKKRRYSAHRWAAAEMVVAYCQRAGHGWQRATTDGLHWSHTTRFADFVRL